ncbi:GGDEF domain-containing protein [Paracoccus marcusii]|uniref:GGDEF domain-containing protein n=1 Tax=Paracoccus marcusii TaxID=59779 RepID=UPI0038B7FCAF
MSVQALGQLLPMHLWLSACGKVLSVGPTLSKLIPDLADGLADRLVSGRAGQGPCPLQAIRTAVEHRRRLFLRVVQSRDLVLRGHGVQVDDGTLLVNLGFGIGLHRAIRAAGLTDDDFAPSELAMELLFLHEANRGVLTELSRFNTQLAQSRELALLQAQTDPLTGLQNRRGLEIALSLSLRTADFADEVAHPFAIAHLDLDHFKQVNDQLGHQAGDDLLRAVGAVLRSHIRKADTAARIGGDEFVLILRGMTSRAALQQLADRIIVAIRALSPPELTDLQVSASLGILVWHPGGPDQPEQVLAMADKALYLSKGAGRGRATII